MTLVTACLFAPLPVLAAKRYALVIGENVGLRDEETLRFAKSDARHMADVLTSLGQVAASDLELLAGASASDVRKALDRMTNRVAKGDQLIVYISSHASDGLLHLDGTVMPMRELREEIESSAAGIVLLILDTCDSGRIVEKGLRATPGSTPIVVVETPSVRGRAIIGASGAQGFAQESDLLGGSVFTQHLIAGLRGAADVSHDGQITLQEAYTYASQRTLDSTFDAQRPTFSFQLAGERDLVLSEVGRGTARLQLEFPDAGEWMLSAVDGAGTISKFAKAQGTVTLALDPGTYHLQGVTSAGGRAAIVTVPSSGAATVRATDLIRADVLLGARKGQWRRWEIGAGIQSGPASVANIGLLTGFEVGVRRLRLVGPLFAGVGVRYRLGSIADTTSMQHELELSGNVGAELLSWRALECRLLAQTSAVMALQNGDEVGSRHGLGPGVNAGMELVYRMSPVSIAVTAGAGVAFYKVKEEVRSTLLLPFGGRVLWAF